MKRTNRGRLSIGLLAIIAAVAAGDPWTPQVLAKGGQSGGGVITITQCPSGTIGTSVEDGCEPCPLGYTSDQFRERCVEDDGWTAPPDPCELDPAQCTGPEDPSPDPGEPDVRECFECRAGQAKCMAGMNYLEDSCRKEAVVTAAMLCQQGIHGPDDSRSSIGQLPGLDEFDPLRPGEFVNRLNDVALRFLECVDSHLQHRLLVQSKDGKSTATFLYGGLWGECGARYQDSRRECLELFDCSDKCKGESVRPLSLDASAPAAVPVVPRLVTVDLPTTHDGYLVDACRFWSRDCGLLAAHQYCRNRYGRVSRARAFELAENIGHQTPTKTLLGGEVCDQEFCDGFASITCSVDALPRWIEFPRLADGRLAYCEADGTTCGRVVADRFCAATFGPRSYATAESEDEDFAGGEPTVTLNDVPCVGVGCRAFLGITCRSPELLGEMLALGREDEDGDGVQADVDNCPAVANSRLLGPTQAHQSDRDYDGLGDACDGEPDMPTSVSRLFEVRPLMGQPTSTPTSTPVASHRCRKKQLPAVAAWIKADLACQQGYLEHRDGDAVALCRAEGAVRLANDLYGVLQRMEARGEACSLTGSPTALFEFVDDIAGRATTLHRLALLGVDLDDPRERAVARQVIEHMASRAAVAVRKAGKVVRGGGAKRYDARMRRLERRFTADLGVLAPDAAAVGVRLHSDWLAGSALKVVRDLVDLIATVD